MRGHAIQCASGQPHVDIIIPIVFQPKEKLSHKNMSALLIQVKNQVSAVTTAKALPLAGDIQLFDDGMTGHPYISMALELGLQVVTGT
jgi:hypothetical protein